MYFWDTRGNPVSEEVCLFMNFKVNSTMFAADNTIVWELSQVRFRNEDSSPESVVIWGSLR